MTISQTNIARGTRRCVISGLALLAFAAATSPALAQTYTLSLSGPTGTTVGQPTIVQATGSNPPDDFFTSWLDVSAIPTSVLATCPTDYLNAAQVARSSFAYGGDVVVTAQRENVDAAGSFSLPFGFTPTKPGRFLLCGYTNDGATWTHATASMTVNVSGGSVPGPGPAPAPGPAPRAAKPMNVKKPQLARVRGSWSAAAAGGRTGRPATRTAGSSTAGARRARPDDASRSAGASAAGRCAARSRPPTRPARRPPPAERCGSSAALRVAQGA